MCPSRHYVQLAHGVYLDADHKINKILCSRCNMMRRSPSNDEGK